MAALYRYFIRWALTARYFFHRVTRTGSFGPGPAVFFTPAPRDSQGQSLQAGLLRHHVKQFHESSCSVASVVNVINVLLEKQQGRFFRPVTQQQILDRVKVAYWKERMGPNGHNGRRGLPIDVLAQVVKESLAVYAVCHTRVQVIHAGKAGGASGTPPKNRHPDAVKQQIQACLEAFQQDDACLAIAHFDQGSFVRDLNIPHISPVGGYDSISGQVAILDVDSSQHRPYTIPFDRFYKGISTGYGGLFRIHGYTGGGLVVIHLK